MRQLNNVLLLLLLVIVPSCNGETDNSADIQAAQEAVLVINNDIVAFSAILQAVSRGLNLLNVTKVDGEYVFSFSDGTSCKIDAGNLPNSVPALSITEQDKEYYWVVYVQGKKELLLDAEGNNVAASGDRAVVPVITISENGYWAISVDGGISYQNIVVLEGEPIAANEYLDISYFKGINIVNGICEIILQDGATITIEITPVKGISLNKTIVSMNSGGSSMLIAKLDSERAVVDLEWSVSDGAVVSLDVVPEKLRTKSWDFGSTDWQSELYKTGAFQNPVSNINLSYDSIEIVSLPGFEYGESFIQLEKGTRQDCYMKFNVSCRGKLYLWTSCLEENAETGGVVSISTSTVTSKLAVGYKNLEDQLPLEIDILSGDVIVSVQQGGPIRFYKIEFIQDSSLVRMVNGIAPGVAFVRVSLKDTNLSATCVVTVNEIKDENDPYNSDNPESFNEHIDVL